MGWWERLNSSELETAILVHDHCSALVRVLDDFSDLYASHTTYLSPLFAF
jgi:hypothetical protein